MSGLSRDPILPSVLPSQLLSELARRGMDTAPLRARFELPPSTDEQPFVMVPLSRLRAFADEAALLSGDDFLGLHAGENGRSNILSVLAFACSGVRTGRDALEAFVKYVSTVHDELKFTLHERPGGVELRMKLAGHPDCLGRQGNEHWMASYLSGAAEIAGVRRAPGAVWLAHSAPRLRKEIVRVTGTSHLTFDAGHNGILFLDAHLDAPVRNTDSREAVALGRYSARTSVLPPAPTAFLTRVREAVEERLPSGAPPVGDVARALGMSGRTFQRRLAEEGRTYSELVDGVRRDLALAHVERRDLSLDEIAARVGYAQRGAFFRSFRRWTGKTPRGRD